jgi:hypothetical protein
MSDRSRSSRPCNAISRQRRFSQRQTPKFLCADLELTPEVREDHASYLASWLKILREDTRAIFRAANHAQSAADYPDRTCNTSNRAALQGKLEIFRDLASPRISAQHSCRQDIGNSGGE